MDFMNALFSPLSKEYCVWFYWVSIFYYVVFLMVLLSAIVYGIKRNKDFGYYLQSFMMSLVMFFNYFIARLFYSMCVQ
jgi:hypothetical protein